MHQLFFYFFISFFSFSGVAQERDLFTSSDKVLLEKWKASSFFIEKMREVHKEEATRFFHFLLGLDSFEDKKGLKKLNFGFFSKMEDDAMIRKVQEKFIQDVRLLEAQ